MKLKSLDNVRKLIFESNLSEKGKSAIFSEIQQFVFDLEHNNSVNQHQQEDKTGLINNPLLKSSLGNQKNVIILAIDSNYNYLYFNQAYKNSMKIAYGVDVVVGMNLLDCISSKEDIDKSKTNFDLALSGKSHSTIQEYGDISKATYESFYNPIYNDKNEIIGTSLFAIDISKRIESEKELKYERNLARMYFDVAGVILLVLDSEGNVSLINKKGCEVIGLPENEIIGKNWFDHFIPKSNIDTVKKVFDDVFNKGREFAAHFENPILNSNGKERIIKWYNTIIYDVNELPIGVLSSGEDITDSLLTEEQLVLSTKNLLESQRIAHLGTWRLDVKTNKVIWTEELYKMYGFDPTLPPPDYTEHMKLFTKESWEKLSTSLSLTSTKGIPYELELETVTKDGSNGWMWVRGEAEKNDNGEIVAIWGAAQDITERVKTLQLVKESQSRLDMFFNQSLTGFFIMMIDKPILWNETVDKEEVLDYVFKHQKCTRVNQALLNQYGIELDDFLNKTPNEMFAHDIQGGKYVWRKMFDDGVLQTITDERKSDGTQIFIEGHYICMYDSEGRIIGHFGNQLDVTSKIQRQQEIEYLSNHDYLTGLFNRRYYFEQIKKLDIDAHYPLGIMMLDVNGLKIINDAFGHYAGDNALIKLGNVLKHIFGKNNIVARIGGDEFAVLLSNSSIAKLQFYKDQIVETVKKERIENIELSLAVGYELKLHESDNIEDILKASENHMYRHKTTVGTSIRNKAISAILETLTEKYENERKHSQRVSSYCRLIGQQLKLRSDEIKELEQAGLFHDIGKISIPDSILNKPDKLTKEEYEIIKSHTEVGYQILRAADEYSDLAIQALHHHERWDGFGYPNGLKETDIPLFSRIIGVVDAYEAMTADRPYRKRLTTQEAISEMKKNSGTQFDPKIVKVFLEKVLKIQN